MGVGRVVCSTLSLCGSHLGIYKLSFCIFHLKFNVTREIKVFMRRWQNFGISSFAMKTKEQKNPDVLRWSFI